MMPLCIMAGHLTAARLRELLHYDPETGIFTWLPRHTAAWWDGRYAGTEAGSVVSGPYRNIFIRCGNYHGSGSYQAHRLAWLYMTGAWPSSELDHINRDTDDNRWCNLREATKTQNMHNMRCNRRNLCGFKGVSRNGLKWVARIHADDKTISLGLFATPQAAHIAYVAAAKQHFGEFARAE